ncbi:uncharacterized protein LOC124296629 [Neodiprion lecontei]|uniref:Uncharacterized protein LOC124296629 n=1 Tax=Neodiprion lecontei TaxID=441921 RepID=A0ABM3GQU3_NEOLC|nr:uncharacterized protein LOC124296629 [Neodiprion lecontei]
MMQRNILITLAVVFGSSIARMEYENHEDDWARQNPFRIVMSWYLKRASSVTVRIFNGKESESIHCCSARLITAVCQETDTAVLVRRYSIPVENGDQERSNSGLDSSTYAWSWPSGNKIANENNPRDVTTILLVPDAKTFNTFLDNAGPWQRNAFELTLIIIVSDPDLSCEGTSEKKDWKTTLKMMLQRIWTENKVTNVFLTAPTSACIKDYVFAWDPFALGTNKTLGRLKRVKVNMDDPQVYEALSEFVNTAKNMNMYPLKVTIFQRTPTVLLTPELDRTGEIHGRSDLDRATGLDIMVLKTLSLWMNFSVDVYPPSNGAEYGYQIGNGTWVGMIGDVAYGRIDFAANGAFLKDYGANNLIEFTSPTNCESMCIVVPRSKMIPQWLQIFQCFSPLVWILLFCNVLVCGMIRYCLHSTLQDEKRRPSGLMEILIITAMIFANSPEKMPVSNSERIFVGVCLLFSIIIVGTFQGSLYQEFTNPRYYRNLNTLAELDQSGLLIGTTSPNLGDIFGEDDNSPTLTHLRQKIKIFAKSKVRTIDKAASGRNIAAIERRNDLMLSTKTKFLDEHGEPILHVVNECPRTYHLAYMVQRDAFFLKRMNVLLRRMFDSGLTTYWYNSTVDSLIMKHHYAMAKRIETRSKLLAFKFENLQISFITLGCGLLLSTIVFIGERIKFFYNTVKRNAVRGKHFSVELHSR